MKYCLHKLKICDDDKIALNEHFPCYGNYLHPICLLYIFCCCCFLCTPSLHVFCFMLVFSWMLSKVQTKVEISRERSYKTHYSDIDEEKVTVRINISRKSEIEILRTISEHYSRPIDFSISCHVVSDILFKVRWE